MRRALRRIATQRVALWLLLFCNVPVAMAVKYVPVFPGGDEIEEKAQLRNLSREERLAALRRLSPEKKKRYAEFYRWFDTDLEWRQSTTSQITWESLLALGDPITAQYLVGEFQKREGVYKDEELLSMFDLWCAPEAVPFLAGLADSDAPLPEFGGPNYQGHSFIAEETLFRNLGYAYYLPKEVQAWGRNKYKDYNEASRLQDDIIIQQMRSGKIDGYEYMRLRQENGTQKRRQMREIAKQWWRDNREAFLAGRYHEVKPGAIMATAELKRQHQIHGTASNRQPGQNPDTPVASAANTPGERPRDPIAEKEHNAHTQTNWLLLAGATAAIAAVASWLRSRGREK